MIASLAIFLKMDIVNSVMFKTVQHVNLIIVVAFIVTMVSKLLMENVNFLFFKLYLYQIYLLRNFYDFFLKFLKIFNIDS